VQKQGSVEYIPHKDCISYDLLDRDFQGYKHAEGKPLHKFHRKGTSGKKTQSRVEDSETLGCDTKGTVKDIPSKTLLSLFPVRRAQKNAEYRKRFP